MLSTKFDVGQSADLDDIPAGLPMPDAMDTLATPENDVPSSPPAAQHLPVPVSTVVESIDNPSETSGSDESTTGHASVMTKEAAPLTARRMPVVIHGSGKKLPQKMALTPVKRKQRVLLHASVVIILFMSVSIALATVLPQDGHAQSLSGLLQSFGMKQSQSGSNSAQISPEEATATAVMKVDGYDPGPQVSIDHNNAVGKGGTGNNFFYPACTWWAAQRYHDLSGVWPAWGGTAYGNANGWALGAAAYGWHVSITPVLHSIAVYPAGVDGAGGDGHVAVVESINPDNSYMDSNMNVYGHPAGSVVDMNHAAVPPGGRNGIRFIYT